METAFRHVLMLCLLGNSILAVARLTSYPQPQERGQ